MILATYQSLDYLTWKNKRYSELKELLRVSQETNLYWCISANNMQEVIINTYTINVNQPALFVLFETENYFKIDAIKWNHYVETLDDSLLTEDLFYIEHEDAIEYIVTSIPAKRFEVNTTPRELLELVEGQNKYVDSFFEYREPFFRALALYPSHEEIINVSCQANRDVDDRLLTLMKYFLAFKSFLLIPLYYIGMDYLGYPVAYEKAMKILTLNELFMLESAHNNIYINYGDTDILYKRYKAFYQLVYRKIFMIEKVYPNDPCPCGSGKKYKKCCGRNVNICESE